MSSGRQCAAVDRRGLRAVLEVKTKGVNACEHGHFSIALRPPPGEGPGFRLPFKCKSRNHPGACQMAWRALLFARLRSPESWLMRTDPRELVFLTVTLPGRDHSERDPDELHREIGSRWNVLRGWLARRAKFRGDEQAMGYVWVRESHRSGVPHLHLVVRSRALADEVREAHHELMSMGADGDALTIAPRAWRDAGQRAGFGTRMDASVVRSVDAISGYVTKVVGELTKASQLAATPTKVRCYGSSRGFIPRRYKREGWTGWLEATSNPGVPIFAGAAKTFKAHLRKVTQLGERTPTPEDLDRRVVHTTNPLASWTSIEEARVWEAGNSSTPIARVYELKPWTPESIALALRRGEDPPCPALDICEEVW